MHRLQAPRTIPGIRSAGPVDRPAVLVRLLLRDSHHGPLALILAAPFFAHLHGAGPPGYALASAGGAAMVRWRLHGVWTSLNRRNELPIVVPWCLIGLRLMTSPTTTLS